MRQWNPHFTIRRFYGFDGELETERQHIDLEIRLRNGGNVGVTLNRDFELLREPFQVHPGVIVPNGSYDSDQWDFFLSSDPSQAVFADMSLTFGEFFGGDIKS